MKPSKIIGPVLALFLTCLVVTAALTFTYDATKDIIAQTKLDLETKTRQEIFPQAQSFEEVAIPEGSIGIASIFLALGDSGQAIGHVITAVSNGYGGAMEVLVAINDTGAIQNIRLLSDNETPGLGKNAGNQSYLNQYYIVPQKAFTVVKNTKSADDQILALSGATITSKAVNEAVNAAYQCYTALGGVS